MARRLPLFKLQKKDYLFIAAVPLVGLLWYQLPFGPRFLYPLLVITAFIVLYHRSLRAMFLSLRVNNYLRYGNLKEAVSIYSKIYQLVPDSLLGKMARAVALSLEDRKEEALALYNEILQEHPQNIQALYNSAVLYYAGGDLQQAKRRLLAIVAINPRLAYVHHSLGDIYYQLNEYPQALRHLQIAGRLGSREAMLKCQQLSKQMK